MAYNLTITTDRTKKQLATITAMYNDELSNIQAEDTRQALGSILFERDSSEANNLRMAYFFTTITLEQARAEGYKNVLQMIMDVTGLSKSMVTNYTKVALSLLRDENGAFFMPDCLKGFTVTAMLRGLESVGREAFLEDVIKGNVDCTMSVSEIQKYYKDMENTVDTTATVTESKAEAEAKPEAKPEAKSEAKSEAKPEKTYHVYIDGKEVGLFIPVQWDGKTDGTITIG